MKREKERDGERERGRKRKREEGRDLRGGRKGFFDEILH